MLLHFCNLKRSCFLSCKLPGFEFKYGGETGESAIRGNRSNFRTPNALAKSRGSSLRVHFKNTRETAHALRKMPLDKCQEISEDVLAYKQAYNSSHALSWGIVLLRQRIGIQMASRTLACQICRVYSGFTKNARAMLSDISILTDLLQPICLNSCHIELPETQLASRKTKA
ncbi:60S ribosomal protein L17 [Datura stramonium]|uniref:60S ribosomal protein L17 n=1 Tax=Datura stramonium TaxID=4076 RepID=A0ABS8V084_DATST|nr:60S ribosomal protein L17 [Datura stramonium]